MTQSFFASRVCLTNGAFRTLVDSTSTRHDDEVQSQHQRDEKTVTIAIALVQFVLVLAAGAAVSWAINSAFDVTQQLDTALVVIIWSAAALIPIAYLIRSVRR